MSQIIKNAPLLVILGETASGKSKLGLELARKFNGEIICADSWTVRKELNIGTDKPSSEEQAGVRHHLIDVIDPCDNFTAVMFKDLASHAIKDIHSRGKLPIMVGGSGLYIDSVIFNYKFLPPGKPNVRQSLNELSIDQLLQRIHELKLPIRDDVDQRNKRRLIRLIESEGREPEKSNLRENTVVIGLKLSQIELKQAIEKRVDQMLVQGLEKETQELSNKYGWGCEALKGVGYKQWRRYFEDTQSIEETRLQIISATNNLAKKQRTWFKRNKSIHWFHQPVNLDSIVDLVTTELAI